MKPTTQTKRSSNHPYLLLTRTGGESLHTTWNTPEEERSFDLFALAYEPDISYPADCQDRLEIIPGPKAAGYHSWITENEWIYDHYDYIALFDDDIQTNYRDLNRLFKYCSTLQLQLAQPALCRQSYYALPITRRHSSFLHRWTNWVEVMAPIFCKDLLKKCVPSLALDPTGGCVEAVWSTQCNPMIGSIAIIDAIPITHTRRTASAGSGDISTENPTRFRSRRRMACALTGIIASIDNLCGLTRSGEFLHLGDAKFASLICSDILNDGLRLHELLDELGRTKSTKAIYHQYAQRLSLNFEAMNNQGASEELLQQLGLVAIVAGMAYEELSKI